MIALRCVVALLMLGFSWKLNDDGVDGAFRFWLLNVMLIGIATCAVVL